MHHLKCAASSLVHLGPLKMELPFGTTDAQLILRASRTLRTAWLEYVRQRSQFFMPLSRSASSGGSDSGRAPRHQLSCPRRSADQRGPPKPHCSLCARRAMLIALFTYGTQTVWLAATARSAVTSNE